MTRNGEENRMASSRADASRFSASTIDRLSSDVLGNLFRGNSTATAVDMGLWDEVFEAAFATPKISSSTESVVRLVHSSAGNNVEDYVSTTDHSAALVRDALPNLKSLHKISDSASDTSNENIELYILDTISKEFANSTAAAGDSVRVAVFARGTKAAEAIAAGADFVGAEDLLQAIQEMKIDFDLLISTPELMPLVKRIDSILIERGIMPDPRRGTVTNDLTAAIMSAKERIQANSEGTLDELDSLNNNDFSGGFLREKPKSPNITDTENVEKRNNDKPNDSSMFNFEQGQRARKLFAAVVLAALDDAIADDRKYGNGPEQIARWARSRDGREVLSCAGIEPNERVVKGLMEFVSRGVATSEALMANHAAVDVPPVFAALKRA